MGTDFCNCSNPKTNDKNLEKKLVEQERYKMHNTRHKIKYKTPKISEISSSLIDHENETKSDNSENPNEGENSIDISIVYTNGSVSLESDYNQIHHHLTDNWSEESLEWYQLERMQQLLQFIINKHCQQSLNNKKYLIWSKFDVNNRNRLRTKKYLPQLLYSYIWLILKSENTSDTPPKFKQLKHVLQHYSNMIIQILPSEHHTYIGKHHYHEYISVYFERIVNKRMSNTV